MTVETEGSLADKQSRPLHFRSNRTNERALKLSLSGEQQWTPPFLVDDIGEVDLKYSSSKYGRSIIFRVRVALSGATIFLTVTRYGGPAPYRLENHTSELFVAKQLDSANLEE